MTFWVLTFIAEMLEVKGTLYFFDTFMEKSSSITLIRTRKKRNMIPHMMRCIRIARKSYIQRAIRFTHR